MSDTLPKSSPDAAARFMIPGRPLIISLVFQPAIAMYSSPLPASSAENLVVSPIFFASSVSCTMSASDACEMAFTVLICSSKPIPTYVDAAAIPAIPAAANLLPFTMAPNALSDMSPNLLIPSTLIPPNDSDIAFEESPAFRSRLSSSLLAFLMDAFKDWSVSPDIIISSWYFPFPAVPHHLFLNLDSSFACSIVSLSNLVA